MDLFFHFPPDLFGLLVDTIPRLNKSKKDLLLFFESTGVPSVYLKEYYNLLNTNNSQFKKFNVTREVLEVLNRETDKMLGVRRKLLQRVIEFDSFEMCYANDKDRAKANVADIQKLVKLKDTVTKYENYLSSERNQKIQNKNEEIEKISKNKNRYIELLEQFEALFSNNNPQERGKKLEIILNQIFKYFRIGIKEDFVIYDEETGKNYEQIDGVIEINHYLTLLEMKWEKNSIGADKIGRFMSRLLVRRNVDGIIISYSSYTETAIITAKEALSISVIALVDLKDIYDVLKQEKDLLTYFTYLIQNVKLYKSPKPVINIAELPNIDFQLYG
ncbi:Restriction endonuclease [Anaerocolumna jejuensis DSM 15929]|uniref:Restriction endonuclease n=1 Tax=Anaerocolumna jejuensis DSM 15929 TaxID=1121322 RepID=A0A1M6MBD8_9FIRM|nr:restriction endonuclease [Anaerocolumna jejuensis]SHJ80735.1 Restriction endonuclease [Anaerocolumna jejuensis DSM 15929]